jgi:uncharacterized protein YndB with AHSA1/START domain
MPAPVTTETTTPDTLVARVTVAADPPTVWQDFTDADALLAWFWPARLDPVVEVTPEVGGGLRVLGRAIDMGVTGVFKDVEPPHRFTTTWMWDGEEDTTEVEVHLIESDDGTDVVVTHSGNPTQTAVLEHLAGWTDCLTRLHARHADSGT